MSRRVVVGKRSAGDFGVFVSPPGVDAFTAADGALVMSINSKISQLILLGSISSSATIPLGLSQQPVVLLTTYNTHNFGSFTRTGPIRPSPLDALQPSARVVINAGGVSMDITTTVRTVYAAYSKAF